MRECDGGGVMPNSGPEWNAYMRDYKRRRRENGGLPLGHPDSRRNHVACESVIASLRAEVRELEARNRRLAETIECLDRENGTISS